MSGGIGTALALESLAVKQSKSGGMRMKKLLTVMATMALAMALSAVSFAQQDQSAQPSAQQPSAQQPSSDMQNGQQTSTDQQGTQPSSPSQDSSSSMQNTQGTSFTGTVVKAGGKYVLKTSDMNYQLDDQEKAKQFVGQQVKVNGTLDSNTSMIHISDISPLS
jgi:cytoskeletal protein RodZ